MFFDYRNKTNFFGNKLMMLLATPAIFFVGVCVQQYQIPGSFVRANTDSIVVFFMNTYAGKLVLNPQKYEHCITDAKANTPPADVIMCFIKD